MVRFLDTRGLGRARVEEVMEQVIDLFYYLQDIFNLEVEALSFALMDQLLSHFVMPLLLGSLRYVGRSIVDVGSLACSFVCLFG